MRTGAQAFALSLCAASLIAAGVTIAQSQTTEQPAPTSTVLDTTKTDTESPLVRAARQSKAKRKMTRRVITNKDVKQSKGKISVNTPPPLAPDTNVKTDTRSSLEKQNADYKARKAAEERVASDEKKVNELEKDLASIEQAYYEEKDLNRRDTVIQKRFAQVKRQLDDARSDLADARDTLKALTPAQ